MNTNDRKQIKKAIKNPCKSSQHWDKVADKTPILLLNLNSLMNLIDPTKTKKPIWYPKISSIEAA